MSPTNLEMRPKFVKWEENKIDWNLLIPVLREAVYCFPLTYVILLKDKIILF